MIVGAESSFDGVPAEYDWIRERYPNAQLREQSVIDCGGRTVDKLTIATAEGEEVELFFDISDFYGKF